HRAKTLGRSDLRTCRCSCPEPNRDGAAAILQIRMVPRLRLLRPQADAPAADPASDAELVHRLRGGDPRAAVLLWRTHSVMVRGLVVRTIGPGADVEDIVQDVFAV